MHKQFMLPFTAESENRSEPFKNEVETATVFTLSILESKSGVLGGKSEKIAYIVKVGYPLWFIIRNGFTFVFDGLKLLNHN
jgi:hypothetical protein